MSVITKDTIFIDGQWSAPAGNDVDRGHLTVDRRGDRAAFPTGANADIDRAVAAARQAFDRGPWPRMTPAERADIMAKLSGLIQARSQEFADTISQQNGSPSSWSLFGQVFAATMVLDFYTNLAREYAFEDERLGTLGTPAIVRKEPVGVAAAIVPWNVPLFVTMLKLGPAMAAGATVVVKPSPETPLDAYLLAECIEQAGVPEGVINIVAAGREVGEYLVTHPDIDKVAFTGSTAVGKRIGALCGERLRRFTLELGGKSAAIILDDVDVATAIPGLIPASMMNNGQACVAQTRILASRYEVRRGRRSTRRRGARSSSSAIRWKRRHRSVRSSRSASRIASLATSRRARTKARRSRSAAGRAWTAAGSSSPPSSRTSTTR